MTIIKGEIVIGRVSGAILCGHLDLSVHTHVVHCTYMYLHKLQKIYLNTIHVHVHVLMYISMGLKSLAWSPQTVSTERSMVTLKSCLFS